MNGPLASFIVIEMAGLGPVPFCGMMLGDMGANVIRIDRSEAVDLGIAFAPQFDIRNRNKRSLSIDLKRPGGVDALLRIVASADIFLEGFRPGVAERLGIGPDACFAQNPALVYGRASGWGQEGPLAKTAGHDLNYIALTGALDMIGSSAGGPTIPLNLIGDYGGGAMYLAFGILCAAIEAGQTGVGQIVDMAIVDGVSSLLSPFHAMRQSGQWESARGSNILDGGAPFYSTYKTLDERYIAVGAIEQRFYDTLVRALGITSDALPARQVRAHWPEIRAIFAEVFSRKTQDEWCAHFEAYPDACFSPVLTLEEASRHPHNVARQCFETFDGLSHPRPAPRLSRTAGAITRKAPSVGEHSAEILAEYGFSEAEIAEGFAAGLYVAESERTRDPA